MAYLVVLCFKAVAKQPLPIWDYDVIRYPISSISLVQHGQTWADINIQSTC